MDLREIKKRIHDEQQIPTLLEALGCEHIHEEQGGTLIVCQLPPKFNSDNRRSVQIKNNEGLWGYIRSRGIAGDMYAIVGYILYDLTDFEDVKSKIHDIKQWICNLLKYEDDTWNGEITKDFNSWLRPIQKCRPKDIYEIENEVLDEKILHQYIPYGHILWVREGITLQTQRKFGVSYDMDSDRIIYPAHNKSGELIGVKGRYVGDDSDTLANFKYMPLHPWYKGAELYNLHRALPYIQEKNEVLVMESAKACMFLTQWGYRNCVSIEGYPITNTQVKLLKELRVPITFALDKNIEMKQIEEVVKSIKTRLVYCVCDSGNLLGPKDSPTDKGLEVWQTLLTNKSKKY